MKMETKIQQKQRSDTEEANRFCSFTFKKLIPVFVT